MILAEACRQDVDSHCSSVTPGDGKVHQCLVDHQEQLTTACRAETNHLQMTAASNVELSPSLGRACAAERAQHCAGVTPGKARVFNCLLANADAVGLSLLICTAVSHYLLVKVALQPCAAERAQNCAGVTPGKASVFNCLLANTDAVRLYNSCMIVHSSHLQKAQTKH